MEVLKPAIDAGEIKNVGEAYTDGWLPANAQRNMEQFLTKPATRSTRWSQRTTARRAAPSRRSQRRARRLRAGSGQDADKAALNRVALGSQTVSVWKDSRELGRKAAEIAVQLAGGQEARRERGRQTWNEGPKKQAMTAVFLTPVRSPRTTSTSVVDAGWVGKDVVCQGVPKGRVRCATSRPERGDISSSRTLRNAAFRDRSPEKRGRGQALTPRAVPALAFSSAGMTGSP